MQWGSKNRDSRRLYDYRTDDCWSANNNCDRPPCSLPHRSPLISEPLFITTSTDYHDEQNSSFVRSGKSEEEVHELLTEDCSRHIVPLKLTTDRHEASRGITATAGLLVRLRDRSTELSHQPPVSLHNCIPAISIPVY